jgi:hypothetical protein
MKALVCIQSISIDMWGDINDVTIFHPINIQHVTIMKPLSVKKNSHTVRHEPKPHHGPNRVLELADSGGGRIHVLQVKQLIAIIAILSDMQDVTKRSAACKGPVGDSM